jgi:hypothetical protein
MAVIVEVLAVFVSSSAAVPLRDAFKKLGDVLSAVAGAPLARVPPGTRSTMSVVAPGELSLGRRPDGAFVVYSPATGRIAAQTIASEVVPVDDFSTVSQVDVVLVDDSGTMRTCSKALGRRKSHVAVTLVGEFLSSCKALNPDGVSAVATFTSTELEFSKVPVSFNVTEGYSETSIWQIVVSVAAEFPNVDIPKRILVVTDGEDTTDGDRLSTTRALIAKSIVVDSIVLADSDDPHIRDLLPVSLYTGGSCFLAEDEMALAEILRCAAFVNLRFRRIERKLLVSSSDFSTLSEHVGFSQNVAEAMPYKTSDPLLTLEAVFWSSQERSFRFARILEEMRQRDTPCSHSGRRQSGRFS